MTQLESLVLKGLAQEESSAASKMMFLEWGNQLWLMAKVCI